MNLRNVSLEEKGLGAGNDDARPVEIETYNSSNKDDYRETEDQTPRPPSVLSKRLQTIGHERRRIRSVPRGALYVGQSTTLAEGTDDGVV